MVEETEDPKGKGETEAKEREEEEEPGREETPESGRGNRREEGERVGADESRAPLPTTRNWSKPELGMGKGLIPN